MIDDAADTARYFAEVDKELDRRVRRDPRNVARFVKAVAGWAFWSIRDWSPTKGAVVTTVLYWPMLAVMCVAGVGWLWVVYLTATWVLMVGVLLLFAILDHEKRER